MIIINKNTENIDYQSIYLRAIKKFGIQSQINVAIEEMSELTKELCKSNRNFDNSENILEEIADVYIMLSQMLLIFDDVEKNKVQKYIDKKTKRLEEIIVNDGSGD